MSHSFRERECPLEVGERWGLHVVIWLPMIKQLAPLALDLLSAENTEYCLEILIVIVINTVIVFKTDA